jgi:hypothetical protein
MGFLQAYQRPISMKPRGKGFWPLMADQGCSKNALAVALSVTSARIRRML